MTEELEKAIAALYDVFSKYPQRPEIDFSPLLKLKAAEEKLHSRALRDLTSTDFGVYPSKAMTTFGDEEDFKHFLPRLLELYVHTAQIDFDVIFDKLMTARSSMDYAERKAVSNYIGALCRNYADKLQDEDEEDWELKEIKSAIEKFGNEF